MLGAFLVFSSLFQCFVDVVHESSSYHISKGKNYSVSKSIKLRKYRPAKRRNIEKLVREIWSEGEPDVRVLAISWIESRLRIGIHRGDRGRACGTFQIHARHSYPMFRRKRGYVGWVEKENKNHINRECSKLERLSYSVKTLNRLLDMMDKRDLHPCHHNSGFYGKCNAFYKHRVDFWVSYYSIALALCDERTNIMAMMKTGAPALATPLEKIQGYLDCMNDKEAQSESSLYMEGYNKAKQVKQGEEEAPSWAPV